MKKHYLHILVLGILICLGSCREQNPQDPSVDHDMEGVGKSVREGREKAVEWTEDGERDTIAADSQAAEATPLRDSL